MATYLIPAPAGRPAPLPDARRRRRPANFSTLLPASTKWIIPLAEPYLRGYTPVAERNASLIGYRFFAQPATPPGKRRSKSPSSSGFFVGYLRDAVDFSFLHPAPPECLVFWFVEPVGGALHRRLVAKPQSLARSTTEYIRWLTHRPPRFELYDRERVVMVRHDSMLEWPREKYQHMSRNFFIETLAWLVRSGLVQHLPTALVQNGAPVVR